MRIIDIVSLCVRHMWKRKLRTFLTTLGVIIGTAALILTVSLGLANEARFARMFEEWDMDLTIIEVWNQGGWVMQPDGNWIQDTAFELNDAAISAFENIPGVMLASPRMRAQIFIRSGAYMMDVWNVNGVRPDALSILGYEVRDGRLLEEGDEWGAVFGRLAELNFERIGAWDWMDRANRMNRIWMGETVDEIEEFVDVLNSPMNFSYDWQFIWGGMEAQDMDEAFRPIRNFPLNVVGVLEETGNSSIDQGIFMDIEALQSLAAMRMASERDQQQDWGIFSPIIQAPRETYDEAIVRVHTIENITDVVEEIRAMGFGAWFPAEHLAMRQEQQQGTLAMLIAIAAVSIFVAAISIANTMIMAVYERTREIGVMKVIGGAISDIRRMFLLEAALIGLLGGVFGVLLSLGGSYFMNTTEIEALQNMGFGASMEGDVTSLITPWLVGAALIFSSVIGLIFGYFPARRATKLSAMVAIRTD